MIKIFFLIVKITTIVGMIAFPIALFIMREECNYAMVRSKNEEEAISISKKYTKNFIIKFLLFMIPALILNIISNFY